MFMQYRVTTYCFLRTQISERNEASSIFEYSASNQGVIGEANLLTWVRIRNKKRIRQDRLASSPAHWMVDLGLMVNYIMQTDASRSLINDALSFLREKWALNGEATCTQIDLKFFAIYFDSSCI